MDAPYPSARAEAEAEFRNRGDDGRAGHIWLGLLRAHPTRSSDGSKDEHYQRERENQGSNRDCNSPTSDGWQAECWSVGSLGLMAIGAAFRADRRDEATQRVTTPPTGHTNGRIRLWILVRHRRVGASVCHFVPTWWSRTRPALTHNTPLRERRHQRRLTPCPLARSSAARKRESRSPGGSTSASARRSATSSSESPCGIGGTG